MKPNAKHRLPVSPRSVSFRCMSALEILGISPEGPDDAQFLHECANLMFMAMDEPETKNGGGETREYVSPAHRRGCCPVAPLPPKAVPPPPLGPELYTHLGAILRMDWQSQRGCGRATTGPPIGRNPAGFDASTANITQGGAVGATLGCGTESRWV